MLSPTRVAKMYEDRYDFITYHRTLGDRFYWGFEGPGADEAAAYLAPLVREAAEKLELLGRTLNMDVRKALVQSGGVEDAGVRAAVHAAILHLRNFAQREWHRLANELLVYESVDADPHTSRLAMSVPLEQIYRQLEERATHPAMMELRLLYMQHRVKVDQYFAKL